MVMEIRLGDVVRLKKPHPCGSHDWEVVRLGADIGIKCLKCQRRVLLPRGTFERRVKAVLSRGQESNDARQKELEDRIAGLKARLPAHSVPPSMWQELEELEEELEQLKKKGQARNAKQDSPDSI